MNTATLDMWFLIGIGVYAAVVVACLVYMAVNDPAVMRKIIELWSKMRDKV